MNRDTQGWDQPTCTPCQTLNRLALSRGGYWAFRAVHLCAATMFISGAVFVGLTEMFSALAALTLACCGAASEVSDMILREHHRRLQDYSFAPLPGTAADSIFPSHGARPFPAGTSAQP